MEHLLNFLWFLVASAFFALSLRGHSRGTLRCSLPLALGCTALIALLLFPAVSMTDDLQRARLDGETTTGRHLGLMLQLGSAEDGTHHGPILFPVMLLLLLLAARLATAGTVARERGSKQITELLGLRPEAVRPPPVLFLQNA